MNLKSTCLLPSKKMDATYLHTFYKIISLFIFLLLPQVQFGQGLGLHPNGQNWRILESNAIRVIYPFEMEKHAQRIASIINHMSDSCTRSVGKNKLKLDMVLQNRTTIPNGFVAFSPLRSELNCTPPQSNLLVGSMEWLDILAVHEFRHVQQNANTKHGLTRLAYWLSGQTGWSLFSYLSVPNWYFEGDAVITETALSKCGRGRTAFFSNEFRSLTKAGKRYSYLTIRNGSLCKLLPDQYRLGYMMLGFARREKGNDITEKVLRQGSAYKGVFYPFSKAMKRNTGYSTKALYNASLDASEKKWKEQTASITGTRHQAVVAMPKKTITSYHYARYLSDGSLVANKSSYKKTNVLCRIKDGKCKKLTYIGYAFDDYIAVGNDVVSWTESSQDMRRPNKNYSDIVLYDTRSGKRKRLTCHSRYFSPVVSANGERVAAIHVSEGQEHSIHLLNEKSGELMQKIPSPENMFLSRIAWLNENEIACLGKKNSQMALVKINLGSGAYTNLTPWSEHTLEGLCATGDRIYFNASYSGIDNIYAVKTNGSGIEQITSDSIGAYSPDVSPDGKTLVYSGFTYKGLSLESMAVSDAFGKEMSVVEPINMPLYAGEKFPEEGGNILSNVTSGNYSSKPYNKLFRGMRLHSWSVSPSFTSPAITIKMNNILNDVAMELGGGINRNEKGKSFYNAGIGIGRYFVEAGINTSYRQRNADFRNANDSIKTKEFTETSFEVIAGVPLSWIHGNYSTSLRMNAGYAYRSLGNFTSGETTEPGQKLGTMEYSINFSTLKRRAVQHVGNRLGLMAKFNYMHALNRINEKLMADCKALLPGPGRNDNLVLRVAMQSEPLRNIYQNTDNFEYPRGYKGIVNDRFTLFSATYGFPLLYPDRGLWGLTYFKRIRTNLFYDTGIGRNNNTNTRYTSSGFELIFDNTHFNFIPLSFGFRQAYLLSGPDKGGSSFTFFMATQL